MGNEVIDAHRARQWKKGSIALLCLGLILAAFSLPYFAPLFQHLYQCDFLGGADLAICEPAELHHYRPWQRFLTFGESLFYGMAFFVGTRVAGDAARLYSLGKGKSEPAEIYKLPPPVVMASSGIYHLAQFAVLYLVILWLADLFIYSDIRNGTVLGNIGLEGAIIVAAALAFGFTRNIRNRVLTVPFSDVESKGQD